jgi:hypothetical protein
MTFAPAFTITNLTIQTITRIERATSLLIYRLPG